MKPTTWGMEAGWVIVRVGVKSIVKQTVKAQVITGSRQ